jgi:DNA-binding GntR family transcriptional regulator
MSPAIERPEPPYLQIANQIKADILAERLKDGDPVPSAREITRTWDVAIATATKALATLRSEGLVRPVTGRGTVVQSAGSIHRTARDRSIAIHRTGKIYPPGHYAKIRRIETIPASHDVAGALGIEEAAPVVRRQRTTYTGEDAPVSTSVSWFDGDLTERAPMLMQTGRIHQGTVEYVAEQTGRTFTATHVQHAAGFANEDDAAELDIAPGSAVLLSRNRFLDADGGVLEYGESTALPDHWVFYEYTNEDDE